MKWYIIVLIIAVVLAIFLALFFKTNFAPSPEGNCVPVMENNGTKNIVFLTDGVAESRLKDYAAFILNSEPFNLHNNTFNFYYAGSGDCDIVQSDILFCYSRQNIIKASVCKNDYIITVSVQSSSVRSSSYGNFVSINANQPENVILHEFAHAFANLADEYVPSSIPSGSKNCQNSCQRFLLSDGCFSGCSKSSYFRSIDNSIMRTLATNNFGKLNTQLIENAIKNR